MERSRGKLPKTDQVPPVGSADWSTNKREPGLGEWSGRFWLPAGDRVDPTRKYCLIRDDGRNGEMIMDRFGWSDSEQDIAVLQGNRSFA